MKALKPEQYAALLEQYISMLDAEMMALKPSGWPVASLADSYAAAESYAALGDLWESAKKELAYSHWKAAQDARWGEKKLAHMYI